MIVQLDREKKIVLLQALQSGHINSEDVLSWFDCGNLTEDEIEDELNRINKMMYPDTCRRLKRAGLCVDCNRRERVTVNGITLPPNTNEIPD